MSGEHTLDASQIHHDWDASREPVVAIESGDVVHFDLPINGEGQVRERSTVADVVWDFDTIYNLAGPVHVAGAARGETLEIEILELTPGPWGWTAFIPGLGLLADDFPEPFLKIYDLRDGCCSLAGNLKIHEIVDAGVWNVGMTMPLAVFV